MNSGQVWALVLATLICTSVTHICLWWSDFRTRHVFILIRVLTIETYTNCKLPLPAHITLKDFGLVSMPSVIMHLGVLSALLTFLKDVSCTNKFHTGRCFICDIYVTRLFIAYCWPSVDFVSSDCCLIGFPHSSFILVSISNDGSW